MKNIELNAGGLIGALASGAAAGAFLFWKYSEEMDRAPTRMVIGALIAGAFAGNFLWQQLFTRPDDEDTSAPPPPEDIERQSGNPKR
jgi:predicted lipid-binding transport protein (Tim44 family)